MVREPTRDTPAFCSLLFPIEIAVLQTYLQKLQIAHSNKLEQLVSFRPSEPFYAARNFLVCYYYTLSSLYLTMSQSYLLIE